ncbi:MAG TPA: ABC transporter permease subunit [Bacteroidales bacterium]|nr:ABC transporter permease subunit [Bacteroidales bacterium]HOX78181.1 ABC transporter permease subunit [Bacteroidales bacterium]HPM92934.1 ABC transporter permease subunit [Bacteroidales bacterium]
MFKVFKYSFFDLVRSRWIYAYLLFFLLVTTGLVWSGSDLSRALISLMNILLILCPLIGTLFGALYYYNSREFIDLLLALPLPRRSIFLGKYLGLAISLSASFLLGIGLPMVVFGVFSSGLLTNFLTLLATGIFLTFIFTAIAFVVALKSENPIRGFGMAIFIWLFLSVIYDGILLVVMMYFESYPLDRFALIASLFNPVDLSRILIMLQLDISALMGYTGAVFRKFLGTGTGIAVAYSALACWIVVPVLLFIRCAGRKDF